MLLSTALKNRAQGLIEDVRRAASGEKIVKFVPTGFNAIDNAFGGLRLGICTEVMAHTGDGKSAFAKQLAEAGARAGAGVLWFCGEDGEEPTAERFLGDGAGVPSNDIGRLDLTTGELDRFQRVANDALWADKVEVVFECPTVDEVLKRVQDTRDIGGVPTRLVVLDYAQIFGNARNLEDEVAKLAHGLNVISATKDRRVASVLLSQVRTAVLERGREQFLRDRTVNGFVPGLGDTEWCSRAEKSTKAVWSLFRDGRWKREMGLDVPDDTATIHVKKQNFGPTGWEELGWDGPQTKFTNK